MLKKNSLVALGVTALMLTMSLPARARGPSSSEGTAYGPASKRFGIGLYVGEPVGVTFKGYITKKIAIDGVAAWGFRHKAFTAIGDVTCDFMDLPIHSSTVTLPLYAGVGAKVELQSGAHDYTEVGIRVPVGVAVQWMNHPVEIFAEIAPGMQLAPSTQFDLTGGVGVRWYF